MIGHFEHRTEKVIPTAHFVQRMTRVVVTIILLISLSLMVGVIGYHVTESMGWVDAFLNASMIAGGMGPVGELHTNAGKIFASLYAIFSGLFLIATTGVLMAPVFHRILHKFHQPE